MCQPFSHYLRSQLYGEVVRLESQVFDIAIVCELIYFETFQLFASGMVTVSCMFLSIFFDVGSHPGYFVNNALKRM